MEISTAWSDAIERYDAAEAARAHPITTRTTRRQQLEHLARRTRTSPWELTGEELTRYCAAQPWARETRRSRRTTFLSFYRWATTAGIEHESPHLQLEKIKALRGEARPIPKSIYEQALARSDERTRLILRLAHDAGLRRREIASINSRDLREDLIGWSLVVHGKGEKRRIVPLTPRLALDLRTLPAGYAFPGNDDGHLSARWVGKLASTVLESPWTIHTLRHSFASRTYAVERDLFVVQELLGHASANTTRVYVQIQSAALRRTVLAAAGIAEAS